MRQRDEAGAPSAVFGLGWRAADMAGYSQLMFFCALIAGLALLHELSVWTMLGAIWTVQLVHYPLLLEVAPERFVEAHADHCSGITWVVGPAIATEVGSALLLMGVKPTPLTLTCCLLSCFCIGLTAKGAVPLHARLAQGYDVTTLRRLIALNGWRTAAWTLHAGLLAAARLTQLWAG